MRVAFGLVMAVVAFLSGARLFAYAASGGQDEHGAYHVTLWPLESSEVPDEVVSKVRRILYECMAVDIGVYALKFYGYMSDRSREKRIPANILVDFSGLAGKQQKACQQPYSPCEGASCLLLGYTYGEGSGWGTGFGKYVLAWNAGLRKAIWEGGRDTAYFGITSDAQDCEQKGGQLINGHCAQYFAWRGKTLEPLD